MIIVSSFRHPSPINVLRASASTAFDFAFFFSSVAACDETLGFGRVAFVSDLVVLKFAGGLRPVAPVTSAPLEDIPSEIFVLFLTTVGIFYQSCGSRFFIGRVCNDELWPLSHNDVASEVVVTEKGSPPYLALS